MDNVENIKQWLISQFYDHNIFSCSPMGDQVILSCNWSRLFGCVSEIDVYIEGTHPLTGVPLRKEDYFFVFGSAQSSHTRTHSLYGRYLLHFTAHLNKGTPRHTVLTDFIPPQAYSFDAPSARPFITYTTSRGPRGFTRFEITSNCFSRLHNKLWIRCGSSLHAVPPMTEAKTSIYMAARNQNPVLLVIDSDENQRLPKPVRE